jgi:hypothetical protein
VNHEPAEQWELVGNEHHCHRHDTVFPRGEVCTHCTSDPGERIDVIAQAIDDREAMAVEADVMQVAKRNKRIAEEMAAGEGRELLAAPKFDEVYLKCIRLWREMREARLTVARDWALIEHDRQMAGLRGSN